MVRVSFFFLVLLCLCAGLTARGTVIVETKAFSPQNAFTWKALGANVRASIERGDWDSHHLHFRVREQRNDEESWELSSASFREWPESVRRGVVHHLTSLYGANSGTYRVTVDIAKNQLSEEPLLKDLGIDATKLSGVVPAEQLLSPFARKWAYKYQSEYGPNCWHSSMASIFLGWMKPRRLPPEEFSCLLKEYFIPIDKPSRWGDVIRLSYGNEEVHGFTYLGVDSKDSNRAIVFTKNGRAPSYYLFMDLNTVKDYVYPGNEISYFRPVKVALDPIEHLSAPCAGFPPNASRFESLRDPMLEAALRHTDTTRFPAIVY
jgi:hypothetical protein